MPEQNIKTKDKNMAQFDVKYKTVWTCKNCNETHEFPAEAWDAWSKEQQEAYVAELDRQHQH
jgi:RNase P subunit RPR2